MSVTFSADEIFEMACQIERDGASFYHRAAAASGEPSVRDLLSGLKAMEQDHERTFATMREGLAAESEKSSTAYDPDGVAAAYLQALAQNKVFDARGQAAGKLSGQGSKEEVLRTAIGLEKDSILFYLGMKEMVPERLGKEKIDAIIREEMGHITQLNEQLAAGA